MKQIIIILTILFIHWVCDFILQTDKQAKGKSKNWSDLLSHTFNYSIATMIGWVIFLPAHYSFPYYYLTGHANPFYLFVITFICHTITDYFTSRLNSKLWDKGDVHNFFVSLGGDQFLHQCQLILTYYFLTR